MFNVAIAFAVFILLFTLLTAGVVAGRAYGLWHLRREAKKSVEIVTVAEGTIFALLGLLVAFTFTGAFDRFEQRAELIGDEANAIKTAYLRIGLLAPQTQEKIRVSMRQYLNSRISTFDLLPDYEAVHDEWQHSQEWQLFIWNQGLEAIKITKNDSATQLFMPALNTMFDVASKRFEMTKNHSPPAVYLLLIGLSFFSAFLAGLSTADKAFKNSIYLFSYIAITALVLYIIVDMDFPRMGLIREDNYDKVLFELRDQMGKHA